MPDEPKPMRLLREWTRRSGSSCAQCGSGDDEEGRGSSGRTPGGADEQREALGGAGELQCATEVGAGAPGHALSLGRAKGRPTPCRAVLGSQAVRLVPLPRESGTAGGGPVPEMSWRHLATDQVPASYLSESSTFTR